MYLQLPLILYLSATALTSAAVVERDTPKILADYSNLDTKIATFKGLVDKFNSIFDAIPIPAAATNMQNAVKALTADITAAAPFSAADSTQVTSATSVLEVACVNTLQSAENKASAFKSAGLTSRVADALNQLDAVIQPLSTAILSKVTDADKPACQTYLAAVSAKLAETKSKFASRIRLELLEALNSLG